MTGQPSSCVDAAAPKKELREMARELRLCREQLLDAQKRAMSLARESGKWQEEASTAVDKCERLEANLKSVRAEKEQQDKHVKELEYTNAQLQKDLETARHSFRKNEAGFRLTLNQFKESLSSVEGTVIYRTQQTRRQTKFIRELLDLIHQQLPDPTPKPLNQLLRDLLLSVNALEEGATGEIPADHSVHARVDLSRTISGSGRTDSKSTHTVQQLGPLQDVRETMQEIVRDLEAENRRLRSDKDELKTRLTAEQEKNKVSELIPQYQAAIVQIKNHVGALRQRLHDVEREKDSLNQELNQIRQQALADQEKQQLAVLLHQQEIKSDVIYKDTITNLESELSRYKRFYSDLDQALKQLDGEKRSLELQLEDLQRKYNGLNEKFEESETMRRTLAGQCQGLETCVRDQKRLLEDLQRLSDIQAAALVSEKRMAEATADLLQVGSGPQSDSGNESFQHRTKSNRVTKVVSKGIKQSKNLLRKSDKKRIGPVPTLLRIHERRVDSEASQTDDDPDSDLDDRHNRTTATNNKTEEEEEEQEEEETELQRPLKTRQQQQRQSQLKSNQQTQLTSKPKRSAGTPKEQRSVKVAVPQRSLISDSDSDLVSSVSRMHNQSTQSRSTPSPSESLHEVRSTPATRQHHVQFAASPSADSIRSPVHITDSFGGPTGSVLSSPLVVIHATSATVDPSNRSPIQWTPHHNSGHVNSRRVNNNANDFGVGSSYVYSESTPFRIDSSLSSTMAGGPSAPVYRQQVDQSPIQFNTQLNKDSTPLFTPYTGPRRHMPRGFSTEGRIKSEQLASELRADIVALDMEIADLQSNLTSATAQLISEVTRGESTPSVAPSTPAYAAT